MGTTRSLKGVFLGTVWMLSLPALAVPSWEEAALRIAQMDGSPADLIHRACRGEGDEGAGALLPEGDLPTLLRRHEGTAGFDDLMLARARAYLGQMGDSAREAEQARVHCAGLLEEWRLAIAYPGLMQKDDSPSVQQLAEQAGQCVEAARAVERKLFLEASVCLALTRSIARAAKGLPNFGFSDLFTRSYRKDQLQGCDDDGSCELDLDAFRLDRIPWIEVPGLRGQLLFTGERDEPKLRGISFFVREDCATTRRIALRWLRELRRLVGPSPGGVLEPEGFAQGCTLGSEAIVRIADARIKVAVGPLPDDTEVFEARISIATPSHAYADDHSPHWSPSL